MALGSNVAVEKESVAWEVGPTKDVIQAFIETLVDPKMPYTSSMNGSPSEEDQKSIAKQMHAVVLLYNYYHRKQKPELEYLDFVSFCKLALSLRPALTPFMKMIHGSEVVELNGAEDQLSVTEKAIKNACNIAMSLDASKDVPSTEGYPISKVAVLLIDSEKENCLLQFGAVTEGVWSLIEKDIDEKSKTNDQQALADHIKFLQIGFDAVKNVSGIEVSDLVVLEAHVVYSLSKEKSVAQFYMMKCNQSFSINQQFPLDSLLESLQGPFAEKFGDTWVKTDLIDYHLMLPYAGLISSWLQRKDLSVPILSDYIAQITNNKDTNEITPSRIPDSSLADYSFEELDYINNNSSEKKTSFSSTVLNDDSKDSKKKTARFSAGKVTRSGNIFHRTNATDESGTRSDSPNSTNKRTTRASFENVIKDSEKRGKCSLSGSSRGQSQGVLRDDNASRRINTSDISKPLSNSKEKKTTNSSMREYHQSKNISSAQHDANGVNSKVETLDISKSNNGQHKRITAAADNAQLHFEATCKSEVDNVMHSETMQNALALLERKRQGLYSHFCSTGDTLALYDHMIDRIRDGGDIDCARHCIKSLVSGSDPLLPKKELQVGCGDLTKPRPEKKSRFSDTYLPGRSSCQDLEYACHKNNWRMPRYVVQPLDGKFVSNVTLHCAGLTLSSAGALESSPLEARETAAARMMAEIEARVNEG